MNASDTFLPLDRLDARVAVIAGVVRSHMPVSQTSAASAFSAANAGVVLTE